MARNHGISRFFRKKSVLAVNVGVLLLIAWGFAGEYIRNQEMQQEIAQLESQAEQLETRNFELAKLAKRLTSSNMLEKEARLKLNLRRPGEEVVVIQKASRSGSLQEPYGAAASAQPIQKVSNVKKWLRLFIQ